MAAEDGIETGFVDDLLAFHAREQQAEFLQGAGLLDAEGLERLVDVADELLNTDPGKARLLVELCIDVADRAGSPVIVPRAKYVLQQVHEINGDFETKLQLIEAAHDEYVALGMNVDALRTYVGKMVALLELGRYEEALDAGRFVLDNLEGGGSLEARPTLRQARLLKGLVHQNRGGCLEYMGRYDEALEAYEQSEKLYGALGLTERVGEVLDNRGAVLSALGRGTEALRAHETAAAIFEAAESPLSRVRSLGNIGETHLRLANYTMALRAFEEARHLLASINSPDSPADEYLLLRDTADAYLALNLYSEALLAYREADAMLQEAGMAHDHARTLWGMGSSLIARSEYREAERVLAESARMFSEAGNTPMLSGVTLEQALLLAARGDRPAAIATMRRSLQIVQDSGWMVQEVYARLGLADLLLPDLDASESHLLAARRLVDAVALPQLHYRLNERLGRLRLYQGREEEARGLLEAAVDEIERLRGTVVQDSMRVSFLMDKTSAFEDLVRLHLAREDRKGIRRAFSVAERAKSRALVDLLVGVAREDSLGNAGPGLGERVRSLQADLNAVYSELLGGAGDTGEPPTSTPLLHARAAELEGEISTVRLQVAFARCPQDLFASSTVAEDSHERIEADTVLLAYHVVGDEVLAFVRAGEGLRVVRHLGSTIAVNRLLRKLDVHWERFRAGHGFTDRHMALMERSNRQVTSALYAILVGPLEHYLKPAENRAGANCGEALRLAIVPHGPLHRVPFHALFDGERYLIERFTIAYAPSATVYALCQERKAQNRDGAGVFGVEDPSIPWAAAEARMVADRIADAKLYVGGDATVEALQGSAPGSGVLHLACHGLFRSDNPMFSALKLHDGWLVAADALELDLNGALVVLSACESGLGGVTGGDEVLGLVRAFLGAGAATLVVSLWLVQDETTADLMGRYYERVRDGIRPAEALRAAQLELKRRYPHPYYWAPFALVGRR